MANFTRLMRTTLGVKNPEPKTPEKRSSTVKREMASPGAPVHKSLTGNMRVISVQKESSLRYRTLSGHMYTHLQSELSHSGKMLHQIRLFNHLSQERRLRSSGGSLMMRGTQEIGLRSV